MLFQMSGADYQQFRTGGFTKNDELPALMEGLENMKKCKLWIDHTAGLTIGELRARARRMAREHEIKVWIIDYFGLIRADFRRKDRREELGEISMGIKSMAKELNAPVIILAQLNRESAKENRVPTMEDLRDCGQLEQDADIVGILHQPKLRSEPYDGVGTAERDLFEPGIGKWNERQKRINVQIAKQRNGPVGAVELVSLTRSMSFIEHDRDTCRHAKKEAWE
jgi:replicative DNA helicase